MTIPRHVSELISDLTFYRDLKEDLRWNEATRKMLELLENSATNLLVEQLELHRGNIPINVVVAGNFNAGKSSFINSLLGEELCCIGARPMTAAITRFHYGDTERIVLASGQEVSRENYLKISAHDTEKLFIPKERQIDYYYPLEKLRNISITDTPGFSSTIIHQNDSELTMDYCRMADAVILLININDGTIGDDLLQKIRSLQKDEPSPPWYLIVNWADCKPEFKALRILEYLQSEFCAYFRGFFLYSAKLSAKSHNYQYRTEIFQLLQSISHQKKTLLQQKSERFARKYRQMRTQHMQRLHECMRFVNSDEHTEEKRSIFCTRLKDFITQKEFNSQLQTEQTMQKSTRKVQNDIRNYLLKIDMEQNVGKDFCSYLLSETDKILKKYNHNSFSSKANAEKIKYELQSRIDFCNGFWTRQQQVRQKTCQKIQIFLQNCA